MFVQKVIKVAKINLGRNTPISVLLNMNCPVFVV